MAVETHNVTPEDVLDDLSMAQGTVTSTSDGLSTDQLDGWIKDAAGQLNSILQGRSISPEDLGDNTRQLVQSGIKAYARAKAYEVREFDGEMIDRAWEEWGSVRKTLRSDDRDMGDDLDADAGVQSSVDTSSDKEPLAWGSDYQP